MILHTASVELAVFLYRHTFDRPSIVRYNRVDILGSVLIKTLIWPRLFVGLLVTICVLLIGPVLFTSTSDGFSSLAESALSSADSGIGTDQDRSLPPSAPARVPSGRLIVSAESNGTWNLFTADPENGNWQSLPMNLVPARDPAISPDGRTLAFRSRRDGLWEIYSMAVNGNSPTRLTRGMTFSGAPVWSPDGKRIAFESYTRGDLDIWSMNADGSQVVDLTDDSRLQDYGPAWSPDGKWIAFTSWRTGVQQIFILPADCTAPCKATNISQSKSDDQQPAWSPDGKRVAFVSDRDGQRAIYTAEFSTAGLKNVKRITFAGWDDRPTWSPDGQWIAFVSARPTRQPVYIVPAEGGLPRLLDDGPSMATSVTWTPESIVAAAVVNVTSSEGGALYQARPDLSTAGSGHPYEMRRIPSTRLDPGVNKLNGRVADAFVALQARVKQEVGYDYLGVLAEMIRPLDYRCDITCDTLSWHKAGRAFDARLDYNDGRGSALEIVREDQQGETFWRLFLRASAQDGSMGEPMKEAPWDLGYRARWVAGRGEGGVKKQVPSGFYVDFTELARQYGWERISAHDEDDFDWRTNTIATEYWHYQKMQGLGWYQAMREVFSESDLNALAEWNSLMAKSDYVPYRLYLKGVPAPAKAWRWYALGP